jgi:hypothetical protein
MTIRREPKFYERLWNIKLNKIRYLELRSRFVEACELLNKNFRAQVAYLRSYDDLFGYHDGSEYEGVRRYLTDARDPLLEALARHQSVHCSELDNSETWGTRCFRPLQRDSTSTTHSAPVR